jgi:hypothetical protein
VIVMLCGIVLWVRERMPKRSHRDAERSAWRSFLWVSAF